ncbi:hypothetical protein HYPSUDRAFT_763824 [Hypholoma sublateritium FD-334 SS-4]|uniref:Uncharacterized protein n=1 Tax=Hypholoma sublateritium (strain FD-334 SS-4) TaxID=945553 RepID=A0A0D2PM38_HYPSF|nr:hypothetical protein HYPSUDRAFT_763824 [Hypholoma sublateritium FD-334 SS-4]
MPPSPRPILRRPSARALLSFIACLEAFRMSSSYSPSVPLIDHAPAFVLALIYRTFLPRRPCQYARHAFRPDAALHARLAPRPALTAHERRSLYAAHFGPWGWPLRGLLQCSARGGTRAVRRLHAFPLLKGSISISRNEIQ